MTLLFGVAEMTTHPYRDLLDLVRGESTPDSTFAWVIDHGRGWGLVGFAVYGALVTISAEEVVFRGALLTWLRRRGPWAAVAVGLVGGLAAYRTRSIHPALIAITVANVVVLAAVA
jgi:membrane protease YdiL (CAAX protease family)